MVEKVQTNLEKRRIQSALSFYDIVELFPKEALDVLGPDSRQKLDQTLRHLSTFTEYQTIFTYELFIKEIREISDDPQTAFTFCLEQGILAPVEQDVGADRFTINQDISRKISELSQRVEDPYAPKTTQLATY